MISNRAADWKRKFQDLVINPWFSLLVVGLLLVGVVWIWRHATDLAIRSFWLSVLTFGFSLLTWLMVVAKQWPHMLVEGLPDEKNCFMIHSQQGACGVVAAFRFVNKSGNANTVLRGRYQLRIGENQVWHRVENPTLNELKNWLNDLEKQTPGIILNPPEVYPPYTARAQYVGFRGSISWNRTGDEKPPIWLKAEFEMADGESQIVIVELKWSGNWPLQLPTHRL